MTATCRAAHSESHSFSLSREPCAPTACHLARVQRWPAKYPLHIDIWVRNCTVFSQASDSQACARS